MYSIPIGKYFVFPVFLKGKLLNDICNFLIFLGITRSLFQVVVPIYVSISKLLRVSECLYCRLYFKTIYLLILLFWLCCCCVRTFSSCSECSLLCGARVLIAVASLVAEHKV